MSEQNDLNFDDIEKRELKFSVQGSSYMLLEPSAEAGAWRRTKLVDMTEVEITKDEDGEPVVKPTRFKGLGTLELEFLAKCIFPIECHDGVNLTVSKNHVSSEVVGSWPDKIVTKLLDCHKEMLEDEKNPTTGQSDEQNSGQTS